MKQILRILIVVFIFSYVIVTLVFANKHIDTTICNDFRIELKDSSRMHLVSTSEAKRIIKAKGLNPIGKSFSNINIDAIERSLRDMKQIKNVSCYRLAGGVIQVDISQRTPILRIISNNSNYFIDSEGNDMPVSYVQSVYLPVATGNIEKKYATTDLYNFALFLQDNEFWNAQIEQIVVHDSTNVELIPRIGNHTILVGDLNNLDNKFNKLMKLYEDGFSKIGWNKYRSIDLRYKNQVVCSK